MLQIPLSMILIKVFKLNNYILKQFISMGNSLNNCMPCDDTTGRKNGDSSQVLSYTDLPAVVKYND